MTSTNAPGGPLVLGPLLRYVDEAAAAIWVEVAERGMVTVEVAGRVHESHTFTVHGHHYALVDVDGLPAGSTHPYTVHFAGEQIWPRTGSAYPPPLIQTLAPDRGLQLVFGSCRTSVPHDAATNRSYGPDVLRAFALRMADSDPGTWPSLALLLGDQVYADETSVQMQEFIAARRDIDHPPGKELKDFEEYAHLYRLAWTDPAIRWLLSTLSTAMIFDDHDIRDDWNTSVAWQREIRATPWWHDRIVGGLVAYWIYQHIGNLSAAERGADDMWCEVLRVGRDGDAGAMLDTFAERSDHEPAYYRWSYHRDLGSTRVLMLDTRAARVLGAGVRQMVDDTEMGWVDDLLDGSFDHL
ncbi:MAG TPA: alkaline phosphatase D family protein, partial [Nocardioidaceae bacterium]|nr:alkaline phosphatase D family protein [Nocardioidaceae bacterium]